MLTIAPLDDVFGALSNATRRNLLRSLAFRPATVGQLANEHGITLPAIHRHIRVLEQAELIQRRKVGRTNYVALQRKAFRVAQEWITGFRLDWGNDEQTLENHLEALTRTADRSERS